MKDFGDVEVEGFKRTGGKKKFKKRKLSKNYERFWRYRSRRF